MARKNVIKKEVVQEIILDKIESNQLIPFPSVPEETPIEDELIRESYKPSQEELIFALESFISYQPVLNKKRKLSHQGKIGIKLDGSFYPSINSGLRSIGYELETDIRRSYWMKINKALKKDGKIIFEGHSFELA